MEREVNINEALIEAVKDGNFDEVRRLVEQGADVETTATFPPFMWAYFRDPYRYMQNGLLSKRW